MRSDKKVCSTCRVEKPLMLFRKSKVEGRLMSMCKDCNIPPHWSDDIKFKRKKL